MNVYEELCYWYLRLNGFFPLDRFVMHRNEVRNHPSDCDVLAVRPPYVHEDVGGMPDDWDPRLTEKLDFRLTVGLVCEVKGGRDANADRLTRADWVSYAVARLGLANPQEIVNATEECTQQAVVAVGDRVQIAKVLVSRRPRRNRQYLSLTHNDLESFIRNRIRKYPHEKYGDRYFFSSILIQQLIVEESRPLRLEKSKTLNAKRGQPGGL